MYTHPLYEKIEVGQTVVISNRHANYTWEKVVKATKTQITVEGGRKFSRKDGNEINKSTISWHSLALYYGSTSSDRHLMTVEEAQQVNSQMDEEKRRKALARELSGMNFNGLDIETLEQVMALVKK